MASTYRDTMQHYNGTDYDTLLPKSAFATSVKLSVAGWSSNKTQRVTSSVISADDDIIVSLEFSLFLFDRNAGPVTDKLIGAGQRVEQCCFTAVWVARKGNS